MSNPSVNNYRFLCSTENAYKFTWGTEAPTTCPDNTGHTIDTSSITIMKTLEDKIVTAVDGTPNDAIFQLSAIELAIPANPEATQTVTTTVSYPFDMYIWQMSVAQIPANIGDKLTVAVAPNTIIGYATAQCTSGTNLLYVSDTVIANITRGSEIGITDGGSNTQYPGRVISIDKVNNIVTMENNLTHTYAGPAGYTPQSYILLTIYPIKDITFDTAERLVIGNKGLKTRMIPANTPVQVIYHDLTLSNQAVTLYILIEYYYK